MNITVIGTGYVGLVTGTCFAEMGNTVICVDIDQQKIENLNKGIIPIYEPGLEELIHRNDKEGRLSFSTSLKYAMKKSNIIIIAVGTPAGPSGEANMEYVYNAAREIGENMDRESVIVDKSTVPVGTAGKVKSIIKRELILCPIDYPYLYSKTDITNIFLGDSRHWRVIEETLCTFLTSKKMVVDYWEKFTSMCEFEHYPFELPLHEIYKKEYCLSPIPSLAMHCTNINSTYGISPNMDWKELWEENADY